MTTKAPQILTVALCCLTASSTLMASEPQIPPPPSPVECAADARPTMLIVEGENDNPEQFKTYTEALLKSNLYPKLEGYYAAVGDPAVTLEGGWAEEKFMVIARFPCRARAEQFWASDTYEAIKPLREGAGAVRAILFEEMAAPENIKWVIK